MTTDDLDFDPQASPDSYPDTSGPPSEGWHRIMISKARLGRSKSGNPMLSLRYTVIGKDDEFEGREFRDWIVYMRSRFGFGKLSALCQAVDPQMQSVKRDPEGGFDHKSQDSIDYHLLGQVLAVRVEHESSSYVNGDGDKVERVNARAAEFRLLSDRQLASLEADYGGNPRPDLPDDAHEDFGSRKRDKGKGYGGNGNTTREERSSFSDDEIPF